MMGADDENASPHAAKAVETLPIQKQPRSDSHEHSTTKTIAQYFDLERLLLDSLGRSHDSHIKVRLHACRWKRDTGIPLFPWHNKAVA